MTFNEQQIKGLNVAAQRRAIGGADFTDADRKNLAYAESKGWKWQPEPPKGMVAIPGAQYNTREKQQAAFSNIQPVGNTLYGIPIPNQLTPEQLGGNQVAPVEPATFGDVDAMMAGVNTGNNGLRSILEQYNTQLASQGKKDEMTKRLETFTEQEKTGQRDLQEQMWSRFGLDQNAGELQKLMTTIASKQAEFDNLAVSQEGRTTMTSMIGGRQQQIARQKATELAGLSAVAQAYQGNVDMARNIAQDAINAKYQDYTNYYNGLSDQIKYIKEDLTREDQQRVDSLNLVIQERQRLIEEEKDNETGIYNIMLSAAQKGADTSTIQKIMSSKNPREAIVNAGNYLSEVDPTSNMPQEIGDNLYWDPSQGKVVSGSDLTAPTDPITGAPTNPSKVINGFNFTSYATDINWGNKIKGIMEALPPLNNINSLDTYIKSKNSSIANNNKNNTSENAIAIWQAAQESGVPVELLAAISQLESGFGTSNVAKSNNNPGGVTWNKNFPQSMKGTARPSDEGGNYVKFPTLLDGFKSVANNIARRYQGISSDTSSSSTDTDQIAIDIFNGTGSLTKVSVKDYPAVQSKLAQLKEEAKASGDLEGIMRASAGGKDVDATTATSFEKAFNVIGQLGELQSSITDEQTGPIMGIIRSNNPYDEKAKLIQAQLTALIPNLARGIYGEVGVLTDNDVKLYAQTLPNLKSTEEVRQLILASTVRSVQRSIENKIKTQTGLGRDLSGLTDVYTDIKALSDSLTPQASTKQINLSDLNFKF